MANRMSPVDGTFGSKDLYGTPMVGLGLPYSLTGDDP